MNIIRWEELLLFNEDPEYLKSTFAANWGIFFEIMDFVRMSSVNNESWRTKDPHTTGKIWLVKPAAFLSVIPIKTSIFESKLQFSISIQMITSTITIIVIRRKESNLTLNTYSGVRNIRNYISTYQTCEFFPPSARLLGPVIWFNSFEIEFFFHPVCLLGPVRLLIS